MPSISDFVVYADRSVTLGTSDKTLFGDIGVRSAAAGAFAPQLRVAPADNLSAFTTLLSPSTSLGLLSTVGVVQTDRLTNGGGLVVTQGAFPDTMPPLPMAPTATPNGTNVTVGAFQVRTLSPGNYGALSITGTVNLNPGTYSFASVSLANNGHLYANASGTTSVRIAGTLTAGTTTQILPVAPLLAGNFRISVSGASATIGAGSAITALVTVPNGLLTLRDNVVATGAFAARDFVAGFNDTLAYQSGFSPASSTDASCALTLTSQFPLPPLVPVQGVATPVAPLSFVVPAQIAVTTGSPAAGGALLAFTPPGSLPVLCDYVALGLPATAFAFHACSNGAAAGSTQTAQAFTLQPVGSLNLSLGPVTLVAAVTRPEGASCDEHACAQPGTCQSSTCVCSPASPSTSSVVPPRPLPPPPPPVPGCYFHTPNGWTATACATQAEVAALKIPEAELGLASGAFVAEAGVTEHPSLVYSQLESRFVAVGADAAGVTVNDKAPDGTITPNGWSIQANTNKFTAPGGDQAWVQFTIQSYGGKNRLCVWNLDLTTKDYRSKTKCAPSIPMRPGGLQPFDSSNVAGFVDAASGMLTMVANMSWVPPGTIRPRIDGWAVVNADAYGLAGQWFKTSGTVFGSGDLSRALFTDTEVKTSLAVSSCVGDTEASSPACPGDPALEPNVSIFTSKLTGESVNLIRETGADAATVGYLNPNLAVTNYTQTTTGSCLAPGYAYLKDHDGDIGGTPSNLGGEAFWESPDIFLVLRDNPVSIDAHSTETLITPGGLFDIYVRVHNTSTCNPVSGVKALVYLADPSALSAAWHGVTSPDGAYVGDDTHPDGVTIAAGGTELLGPFHFQAPQTGIGDGHKCVLAAIIANNEPQVANKFDAPNFNQVGQRNVQFSDCAAPLTNATSTNGTVQLNLTATPPDVVPALTGSTDIEMSVPDPGGVWAGVWGSQPDSGTAFTVQTSAGTTTVRMGANQVVLNGVALAAGESRSAKMTVALPSGSADTTLALEATLTDVAGTTLVTNGTSCLGKAQEVPK